MCRQILLVAIIASLASITASRAENAPSNADRLKKLLEEKYTPKQTDKPTTFEKKEFHPIVPNTNTQQPANPGQQPNRGGQLAPPRDSPVALRVTTIDSKRPSPLFHFANDRDEGGFSLVRADSSEIHPPNAPTRALSLPSTKPIVIAQQRPPAGQGNSGVIANVYLIQFKPTANEQQVANLYARYGLTPIPGGMPKLLIVRVQGRPVVVGSAEAPTIFTQRILTDLRRDPIVASAAVDTTVGPRMVPSPANTTSKDGGVSYIWSWKKNTGGPLGVDVLSSSVPNKQADGNWGLKEMRMPPVWSIIKRFRAANPNNPRPKVAIIDTGFSNHEDLSFNLIRNPNPNSPNAPVPVLAEDACGRAHGNHVSGIIGATFGNGRGIDGIVPQAKMDAVIALTRERLLQDLALTGNAIETRVMLFGNVMPILYAYLYDSGETSDLRVVNISLGYNFPYEGDPSKVPGLDKNIANQAIMFASLARDFENKVLFITAAGNDSRGRTTPLDAKWSSPAVWAATDTRSADGPLKNILIVEAFNRFRERANFSNVGQRLTIAAPGVEILSAVSPEDDNYGICQGTSQATPHVAGVALLLFELDPSKKPAQIADILRASAYKPAVVPGGPPKPPGGPRLDALEAVLQLSVYNKNMQTFVYLADLNLDGKVDIEDMKIFAKHLAMLEDNRKNGTPFTEDLNGDGVVDANECNWPLTDFNGSGTATLAWEDVRLVQGKQRTDLDVMELAWTDKTKTFAAALKELGIDVAHAPQTAAPSKGCQ